jgi:hypothetical protein
MALESTQPLTETVGKGGRGVGMKTIPPSCGDCLEILSFSTSWSLKGLLQGLVYLSQALFNLRDLLLFVRAQGICPRCTAACRLIVLP